MNYHSYTLDAICNAFGFPAFEEDSKFSSPKSGIRLVLTPSFNVEVCITMTSSETGVVLDVRTFAQQYWLASTPAHISRTIQDEAVVDPTLLDFAARELRQVIPIAEKEAKKWVCLDGIGAAAVVSHSGEKARIELNVGVSKSLSKFVREFLQEVYIFCIRLNAETLLQTRADLSDSNYPWSQSPLSIV